MKINLLQETKVMLDELNIDTDNLGYIGTADGEHMCSSWEDFSKLADFEYDDNAVLRSEHPKDLVIFSKVGFINRVTKESNGKYESGWEFTKFPRITLNPNKLISLI